MTEIKISNAVIESAEIKIDRGFILTAWITVEHEFGHQGFGGYSLYLTEQSKNHDQSKQKNFAGIFIAKVMEMAGVENWCELKGKTIRVKHEHSKLHEIGHIVKDKWFNPAKEFENL